MPSNTGNRPSVLDPVLSGSPALSNQATGSLDPRADYQDNHLSVFSNIDRRGDATEALMR